MSYLLRVAWRCGVGNRNVSLTWSRRNTLFKNWKFHMTARQLSNCHRLLSEKSSSWTKIDLDQVMKEELQNRTTKKLAINVKSLFEDTSSSSDTDIVLKRSKEEVISKPKTPNQTFSSFGIRNDSSGRKNESLRSKKDSFGRKNDSLGSKNDSFGRKNLGKIPTGSNKVVNFSYPKVVIPDGCSTSPVKEFNVLKLVEDYSAYESNPEEESEKKSAFSELFTGLAENLLSEGMFFPHDKWEAVGKQLTETEQENIRTPHKINKHWPLRLMIYFSGKLINSENFIVINSLWEFAQDFYEKKPPPLLLATWMNILASQDQEDKVLEIYEKLNELTKGIPEISIYIQVVSALLCTRRWEDSHELTQKMEKFYSNLKSLEDCWFIVAFGHLMHGNLEKYNQVMEKLTEDGYDPTDSKAVLQLLMKMDVESGRKLLLNFRENLWLPGVDLTCGILSVLGRDDTHSWTVTPTKMNESGQCMHCGTSLSKVTGLNEEQFGTLQSKALAALVDGEDIYLKSNPGERRTFLSFCERFGPFDAVVDGLNLFYARAQHGKTNLQEVITSIKMKYPGKTNILIVLRRHLMKSLGIRMKQDAESPVKFFQANVFPLRNDSEDDPYLLMAALSSGPNCVVVSNDDFSDQSFPFGKNLRPLFLSWQRTNQIFYSKERGSINLQWPKEFEHSVQEHDNGIHLPFSISNNLAAKIRPPNSWLCCGKQPRS